MTIGKDVEKTGVPPALLEWVMREEQFSPTAFWDVDDYSAGFGRHGKARGIERSTVCSFEEARNWCAEDIASALDGVDALLPGVALSPVRRCCLAAMAYQMGMEALAKFQRVLAAVRDGNWNEAAWNMLRSRWAREQTPARAIRTAYAFAHDEWPDAQAMPKPNW